MVFTDTGDMVAYIARHWATAATATVSPPVSLAALQAPFAAVNIGLATFADSLAAQGAEVVSLDWRPPAGGDEKLMALLAKMKN